MKEITYKCNLCETELQKVGAISCSFTWKKNKTLKRIDLHKADFEKGDVHICIHVV